MGRCPMTREGDEMSGLVFITGLRAKSMLFD